MQAAVSDACTACGICIDTCPEVFAYGDDGLAHAIVPEVPPAFEARAREACESCPAEAIGIEE